MTGPVTLGDLVRHCKQLRVVCPDCGHECDCDLASFKLPSETTLPDLNKGLRCKECGSRNMKARPPVHLVVSR